MIKPPSNEENADSVRDPRETNQEHEESVSVDETDEDSRSSCENSQNQELVSNPPSSDLKSADKGSDSKFSRTSSEQLEDNVTCFESLPSSLSSSQPSLQVVAEDLIPSDYLPGSKFSSANKENIDNNIIETNSECSSTSQSFDESCYDRTDLIPLPQLLKLHVKQIVSGFEFGEATKRRAQENMKSARDRKLNEKSISGELATFASKDTDEWDASKPRCSKELSEQEHKTPHSYKRQRLADSNSNAPTNEEFEKDTRGIPECLVNYPDCIEVWVYMVHKEEVTWKFRNPRLFNDFKSVTPRMRAILLDWLMEVAAVYHLRRVTYYLSVDYFDRFLSIRPDIPKSLLQLVGITCLYIAAKMEEIYPPNLSEFAYVCDGACKLKDIVSCELLILNSLGWEVVLTTPSDWLNLYMQFYYKSQDVINAGLSMDFNKDFIFPQFSSYEFTRASQLIDLISLDPGFLKFGYSAIAAGAMYFMYGESVAVAVSGFSRTQLQPCVDYMEAFYRIIQDAPDPRLQSCLGGAALPDELNRPCSNINRKSNDNYSFQTHVATMEYFERATIYRLTRSLQEDTPHKPNSEECEEDPTEMSGSNDDFAPLDDLNKCVDGTNSEQNLMSLDEIFELILGQEETKSVESK